VAPRSCEYSRTDRRHAPTCVVALPASRRTTGKRDRNDRESGECRVISVSLIVYYLTPSFATSLATGISSPLGFVRAGFPSTTVVDGRVGGSMSVTSVG
jgi:hypothetical protein